MNEERGAALRLLYQIKLAVEKYEGLTASQGTMTNLKHDILNKKLQESLNLKATLPQTYGTQLSTVNGSKKLAPIEKHMLPFEYRKKALEDKAVKMQNDEDALVTRLRSDARNEEHRKMEENKEFMQDWLAEGKRNWKLNQQKRADAIARVKYFEDKEVKAYKDKLSKELDEATKQLIGGVDEFEKNLQKLGIEKNTNIEEAIKRMEEKKGIPPGQIQNFSYAATMNKIKEKKNVQDFAAKERDRRRRKMVVDQAKTQSELDQKKNEELLIEKLLSQQAEEHKFAYLERRAGLCKEVIVDSRKIKSLTFEQKKRQQLEDLESKRRESMAGQVAKHKRELQEKRVDYAAKRREEKAQKRLVNVEVCSEIIDLIIDVANEAFEETKKNGKIAKPDWRQWMRYFKDNKVVSRARKGLLNNKDDSISADISIEEQFDILDERNKQPIEEILEVMKREQAFTDFLEYQSASGIFNLTSGDFKEWDQMVTLTKGFTLNFEKLKNISSPVNQDMGKLLYKFLHKHEIVKQASEEEGLPHHLTLKLCLLGKSCSGKRSIAKQLQEHYQGGKIKVFKMDDLIKEVLEYINPKPVADAAQDKNKKPPPGKGKVEDAQPVDPFAGQDTTKYKEIGQHLKKFVGEGDLPQDLTSLIPDEQLLVSLFIQKLKLTFPADKSEQAKIEEIKQNIAKEEQLLEQLAELEAANAAGADPSKAAAKGGAKAAPPKKGAPGGPSGEEQIKAELELVTKVQPEGWILLDFPRTLKQAKAMEQLMTGFQSPLDNPNIKDQRQFERWSKIVDPATSIAKGDASNPYNGDPYIYKSATDGYLFLDVPSEECLRRIHGRKIDPTTGTVYHMEDNPPPEGDPKLKDRLQDYQGEPDQEPSRVHQNHQQYISNEVNLKNWAQNFGLFDTVSPSIPPVNLLLEVSSEAKQKKEEVFEKVLRQISKVLSFKQSLYELKKAKVKASTIQDPEASQQQELKEESQKQEEEKAEVEQVDEEVISLKQGENATIEAGLLTHQSKRSAGFGGRSLETIGNQSKHSKASLSLTDEGKSSLWQNFQSNYYREALIVFRAVRQQRSLVFDGLTQIQSRFLDQHLGRVDTRQSSLIQDFIDSFNKFSLEFPNLLTDPLTQDELKKRVTRLSNDMWALVEQKKDNAIAQHRKLNNDGFVVNEMKKLMKNACRLIQNELQKLFVLQSIITGFNHQLEVDFERTIENYCDDGIKIIDEKENSPLFNEMILYALRILQNQKEQTEQLDEEQQSLLAPEFEGAIYRLNLIRTWVMLKVKEFNTFWQQLYETLDDGIVTAIKMENDGTQDVIQRIQEHIIEQQMTGTYTPMDYSDFRIPYLDLENELQRIDFSGAEIPLYLQSVIIPSDPVLHIRLKVSQLRQFYTLFRYYAYQEYLDSQTFINSMLYLVKTNLVPLRWRYLDFQTFTQIAQKLEVKPLGDSGSIYSAVNNVREYLNWKKLLTILILIASPTPQRQDIETYRQDLQAKADEDGWINIDQFTQVPAWFDDFESITENPKARVIKSESEDEEDEDPDRNRDESRLLNIKQELYKVHQSNTKSLKISEFIKTLEEIAEIVDASAYPAYHLYLFGEVNGNDTY